jgi:hypothetical protein
LRSYLVVLTAANLIWEFAHMPLYTIWESGTAGEIVFAALHCTGGDVLIALASVMLALILFGSNGWPADRYYRVAVTAVIIGLAYTLFSEWLNVEIRQSWAYRDIMPTLPVLQIGLSPILQWILIPLAAFLWAGRRTAA